jgi:hypothetical protein
MNELCEADFSNVFEGIRIKFVFNLNAYISFIYRQNTRPQAMGNTLIDDISPFINADFAR